MGMINFEAPGADLDCLAMGEALRLLLETKEPVELRPYLQHGSLVYPEPLCDWGPHEELVLFPEAPGRYRLTVVWRTTDGRQGRQTLDLTVAGDASCGPRRARPAEGLRLWAPGALDAWQRQHRGRGLASGERALRELMRELVSPGSVVYDVGANLGTYAVALARQARPGGFVYCFEPNPVCVHYLQANLELAGVDNAAILPIALFRNEGNIPFTLNYGNSNLGVAQASSFASLKAGHQISVPSRRLDDLRAELELRRPDLIKMDIEGAEPFALEGMVETLRRYRPSLLIEIHGRWAAAHSLDILTPLGYRFLQPEGREDLGDRNSILERFGEANFHLAALPN